MDLIQNKLSQRKWNGLHMQIETIFHSIPVLLHHLTCSTLYIITIKYYNDKISAVFISKAEKTFIYSTAKAIFIMMCMKK